jgi:hypothetical protein
LQEAQGVFNKGMHLYTTYFGDKIEKALQSGGSK